MDLKKEGEDYIYDSVNKNVKESSKDSKNLSKYKEIDKTILQWCPFVLILMIIIGILLSSVSVISNNFIFTIIFVVSIFLIVFSVSYMFSSLILWIGELIFKPKTDNSKFRFYIKTVTGIVLAILIVFSLFMPICCGPTNTNPTTSVNRLLKNQILNPGAEQCTDPVTFKRNNDIAASGITQNTGLDSEQVFFTNEINDVSNFTVTGDSKAILKYSGTSSKKVVLCIICSDKGKTGLQQAFVANGVSVIIDSNIEGQTLCIVYPRKTA